MPPRCAADVAINSRATLYVSSEGRVETLYLLFYQKYCSAVVLFVEYINKVGSEEPLTIKSKPLHDSVFRIVGKNTLAFLPR